MVWQEYEKQRNKQEKRKNHHDVGWLERFASKICNTNIKMVVQFLFWLLMLLLSSFTVKCVENLSQSSNATLSESLPGSFCNQTVSPTAVHLYIASFRKYRLHSVLLMKLSAHLRVRLSV